MAEKKNKFGLLLLLLGVGLAAKGAVDNIASKISYEFQKIRFKCDGFLCTKLEIELDFNIINETNISATLNDITGEITYGGRKVANVELAEKNRPLVSGDNLIRVTLSGIVGNVALTIIQLIVGNQSALQAARFRGEIKTSYGTFPVDETREINL